MKSRILFSLFLFSSLLGYTQQKNDSKVIAHVSDTAGIFNHVVKTLLIDGYDLETKDQSAGIVSTKEKQLPTYPGKSKLRIVFSDSTLIITSSLRATVDLPFGDMDLNVTFGGAKRSMVREAWNVMVKEAKQFSENITYAR